MIRWAGTLLLGGYLLGRTDGGAILAIVSAADLAWLGLAVALYAVDRLAAGLKWRLLFNAFGQSLSLWHSVKLYLQSSFLGAALPATVGMDLIRAHLAGRMHAGFTHAISSIIAERFLGAVALLMAAVLLLALFGPISAWREAGPYIVVGTIIVVVAAIAIMLYRRRSGRRSHRGSSLGRAIVQRIRSVFDALQRYAGRPAVLGQSFAITFGQQILLSVITWTLARALGLPVGLTTVLWIWPIVMLAVRIPVSVLGFGVREFILVEFLVVQGIPSSAAVALGLASGVLDLVFIGAGGLLVLQDSYLDRRVMARHAGSDGSLPAAPQRR